MVKGKYKYWILYIFFWLCTFKDCNRFNKLEEKQPIGRFLLALAVFCMVLWWFGFVYLTFWPWVKIVSKNCLLRCANEALRVRFVWWFDFFPLFLLICKLHWAHISTIHLFFTATCRRLAVRFRRTKFEHFRIVFLFISYRNKDTILPYYHTLQFYTTPYHTSQLNPILLTYDISTYCPLPYSFLSYFSFCLLPFLTPGAAFSGSRPSRKQLTILGMRWVITEE